MSHANGVVKFEDGTIRYFEYDGNSDVCCPKLWTSYAGVRKHWREVNRHRECTCGRPPEPVEAFTDYGMGFEWRTTACRHCRVIVGWGDPHELGALDGAPEWVVALHLSTVEQTLKWQERANAQAAQREGSQLVKDDDLRPWRTIPASDHEKQNQRILAQWAADCAEHMLPCFEERHPQDNRPRQAVEAVRAWAAGGVATSSLREAAFAAWAAAHSAKPSAAHFAAFAAGHAVAVAISFRSASTHAVSASIYAREAASAVGRAITIECDWQRSRLPERLWHSLFPPPYRVAPEKVKS